MTFSKKRASTAKKQGRLLRTKFEISAQPTSLQSAILTTLKQNKLPSIVDAPNKADILFGRGGESNNAKGNMRYQKVIAEWSKEYSALTSRKAKTQLAWQIYCQLRQEGARFLKREKGSQYWTEAPEADCRKKISQRLRERALEAKEKREMDKYTATPEVEQVDFDDASIVLPLPEDVFDGSDDSIESLVDFADEFPASWMLPEQVESPMPTNFASGPDGYCSAPVEPDQSNSYGSLIDPFDPYPWQQGLCVGV